MTVQRQIDYFFLFLITLLLITVLLFLYDERTKLDHISALLDNASISVIEE